MAKTIYGLAALVVMLDPGRAAHAGANVQLHVASVSEVTFSDRASNHPLYVELRIRGVVSQSDAAVQGLPTPLPQTVRLLFRPWEARDAHALRTCVELALAAKASPEGRFTVHLFMNDPNGLPVKIEGGMTQPQFNSFVVMADDADFTAIGCSLQ